MKRLLEMPMREQYYSDFDEFSDTDSRVIEVQEVALPNMRLGWFFLILVVDIAALVGIYVGIAKAMR